MSEIHTVEQACEYLSDMWRNCATFEQMDRLSRDMGALASQIEREFLTTGQICESDLACQDDNGGAVADEVVIEMALRLQRRSTLQ